MALDALSKGDPRWQDVRAAWEAAGLFFLEEPDRWAVVDGPGWLTRRRVLDAAAAVPAFWDWAWRVRQVVPTTMTVARVELMQAAGPVAVLADRQTRGRGRRGRRWESLPGAGLHLSLGWRPAADAVAAGALTLRVGLAAAEAIQEVTGVDLGLKWPNDGLWNGQKVMGVLCEGGSYPKPWVVAGIGMNVSGAPPPGILGATTLQAITGRPWSRAALAAAIAAAVARECSRTDDSWFGKYQVRSDGVTLGQRVQVFGAGAPAYEARAEAVDHAGALWVRRADNTRVRVTAGDVSIRPPVGRRE